MTDALITTSGSEKDPANPQPCRTCFHYREGVESGVCLRFLMGRSLTSHQPTWCDSYDRMSSSGIIVTGEIKEHETFEGVAMTSPPIDADAILRAAQAAVSGRGQTHGDMHKVFAHAARLWSADLGITITAEQVAWCQVHLKRARAANGEFNLDDYVDSAGYSGCAGALAQRT